MGVKPIGGLQTRTIKTSKRAGPLQKRPRQRTPAKRVRSPGAQETRLRNLSKARAALKKKRKAAKK